MISRFPQSRLAQHGVLGERGALHQGGKLEILNEQVFVKAQAPREPPAFGVHNHAVPVEDEVILTADQVHVGDVSVHGLRPSHHQRLPHLVFISLKGGCVGYQECPQWVSGQTLHGAI